MPDSPKVRMSLQDLKVKSFATTPSLRRDEGTVRGLDTCGDCTITTNDCFGQTCGDTCGMTGQGGTGACGQQSYTGGCGGMSDGCGAYHTHKPRGCDFLSDPCGANHTVCEWTGGCGFTTDPCAKNNTGNCNLSNDAGCNWGHMTDI